MRSICAEVCVLHADRPINTHRVSVSLHAHRHGEWQRCNGQRQGKGRRSSPSSVRNNYPVTSNDDEA